MKYYSEITGCGDEALDFLDDPETNFIVLFDESAPQELKDISVLHKPSPVHMDLSVGDTLILCDKVFNITAIGDKAGMTLKNLGHCTICFNGGETPDRPGCIMVSGDEALVPGDFVPGRTIEIY